MKLFHPHRHRLTDSNAQTLAHCDGSYTTPDNNETSYYTLHLYLNDSEKYSSESKLKGGATTFHSMSMWKSVDVDPKAGRVLLFQQRGLLHSGEEVLNGTKVTMRTEIMYERV